MIQAIATDLDSTFMHHGMTIAALNTKMVRAAVNAGIHFVVASGRQAPAIGQVMTKVGVTGAKVCLNGAYVEDERGQTLVASAIAHDRITQLFQLAVAGHTNLMLYRKKGVFRYDVTNNLMWHAAFLMHGKGYNHLFKTSARMLKLLATDEVYKVGFNHPDHAVLVKIHDQLVHEPVSMVWASANFLEITNLGVNKLSGLKALAATWHTDVQDFVAFGDYENDLAMIEGVGYGVAMSNAIPEVKQVANTVVDNHDHAGVGRMLQALLAN
ncbi:HAD family hydrolase [Lacticaseibacillus porcinae]|uniref:HAD family hydrolase n=1 Tax=Lacticaseibacillus porcinae TaxID=1123687 RepID=UPI000F7A01C5|nr:HAD family hydrolase [Lacticaseibacillus porcinae]